MMKGSVGATVRAVRLFARPVMIAATIGLLALGSAFAQDNQVPAATAGIYTQGGRASNANAENFTPEQDLTVDKTYGDSGYSAHNTVSVSFGTAGPPGLTADASIAVSTGQAWVSAGAMLKYYFKIVEVGTPPWTPAVFPMALEASAHGEVTGDYGLLDASVVVQGDPNFPASQLKIHYEGKAHATSFLHKLPDGQPVPLDLQYNFLYPVMYAVTAATYGATNLGASSVHVDVDPIIRFDQDTFNAWYPTTAFPLSDYFRLVFSANVTVNRPPTLAPIGDKTVAEGQLLEFIVSATDPEGDALTYSASDLPSGATFDAPTRTFRWTPGYTQAGSYRVLFTVTDAWSPPASSSETVTINVGNTNRPPVLNPLPNLLVDEGQAVSFMVAASDPDQDALAFTASEVPRGASFDPATRMFTWIPDYDQAGNYPIRFTVTDAGTPPASDTTTVTITVGNVNRPPRLGPVGNKTTHENQPLVFQVTATDPDNDTLTYAASNLPPGAVFDPATQTFTWTPGYDQAGNYPDVRFTVTDSGTPALTTQEAIIITVGNVNRPPALTPIGNKSVDEGALLAFTLTATDPDGDPLTFAATNPPPGATFDPGAQEFRWVPGNDQAGQYENVEFSVSDNGSPAEGDVETITITVGNVNRAPVFTPVGTKQVLVNQLLQFTVSASDADGDTLTYSVMGLPNGAAFNPAAQLFSWQPDGTQVGTYTVTFSATDSGSPPLSGQLDVVINVGGVATPCQAVNQLIQAVLALHLPKVMEDGYLAHLKKACSFVENGKLLLAFLQMDAFILRVAIDMGRDAIGDDAGWRLIDMAVDVIRMLRR